MRTATRPAGDLRPAMRRGYLSALNPDEGRNREALPVAQEGPARGLRESHAGPDQAKGGWRSACLACSQKNGTPEA